MILSLAFHGAAGTVTGSHYILRTGESAIAIDCGMFQGPKALKELNYRDFPSAPREIDAILSTHAHIDHTGALPKFVKGGFDGPIYATSGTIDLLQWMLPDSASIQEAEVAQLNRRRHRSGEDDVKPIYDQKDVRRCLSRLRPVEYGQWYEITKEIKARWWNAGHILGSASIEIKVTTQEDEKNPLSLLFSGDIGPRDGALQPPAEGPSDLDYLIVESTYGNRQRPDCDDSERLAILERHISDGLDREGMILIPAFAIERTQELLGDLAHLIVAKRLPKIPIYVDSPLASRATEVFDRHLNRLDGIDHGQSPFRLPNIHYVQTLEQSRALNRLTGGAIIIAASGMCDAGRIRHHLRHHLWRSSTLVLLVGYQAPGTLGRMLEEGIKEVKIFGEPIKVKADIQRLDIYSGHADRNQLLRWVKERLPVKRGFFLVHGEEEALAAMKQGIAELKIPEERLIVPELDALYRLDGDAPNRLVSPIQRLTPVTAEEAKRGWDWHNELSALTIDLRRHLNAADNDDERMRLLKDVRRALRNGANKN